MRADNSVQDFRLLNPLTSLVETQDPSPCTAGVLAWAGATLTAPVSTVQDLVVG